MRRRRYLTATGAIGISSIAGCLGSGDADAGNRDPSDTDHCPSCSVDDASPRDPFESPSRDSIEDLDWDDLDGPEAVKTLVGGLVEGDHFHLVVESVELTARAGGWARAGAEEEFVVVQVALKNVTDEFIPASELLRVAVRDDEKYDTPHSIGGITDPNFNGGQFAPGEVERGTFVFEATEDSSRLELLFDVDVTSFGGIDRVLIDLTDETDVHLLQQDLGVDSYGPGGAVEVDGVGIELRAFDTAASIGSIAPADQGQEYLIVDIAVSNDTGAEQQVGTIHRRPDNTGPEQQVDAIHTMSSDGVRVTTTHNMMLKDGSGWTYLAHPKASTYLDRPFDLSSDLEDGKTRSGRLAYQVDEGLSPLYWVFEFSAWTEGDKTFWDLR